MHIISRLAGAVALALTVSAGAALAVPVTFTAETGLSGIAGPNGAGVALSDRVVVEVVMENGLGLAANSWVSQHLVSAAVTVGSGYSATFDPLSVAFFATDAAGHVTFGLFQDFTGNADTLGQGMSLLSDHLIQSDGTTLSFASELIGPAWTASVQVVPLPAALPLLAAALGILGLASRRRMT